MNFSSEENASTAYKGLPKRWMSLDERLSLTYINRDATCNELEGELSKWPNITGWKPDVIVIDYMEESYLASSEADRFFQRVIIQFPFR